MRLFHVISYYKNYLDIFYKNKSELKNASFREIKNAVFHDGFSAVHLVSEDLKLKGHQIESCIAEDRVSQYAWAAERGKTFCAQKQKTKGITGAYGQYLDDDLLEILLEQINYFQPDVLYVDEPIGLDGRFLRMLKKKPALAVAWRAASIPKNVRWREYDLLISNHTPSLLEAKKQGTCWQEYIHPGFPAWISEAVANEAKCMDVVFTGSLSAEHSRRIEVLRELAVSAKEQIPNAKMAFYSEDSADLPSEIREYIRPPLWGMEMYKCLKSAKIVLNIHIDLAANEAANMRLFEVTGVGSFLLTDAKPNLAQFFEPGVEVETFHTTSEMMQKIRFYLDHPIERERISKSGQDHCLKMFSRQKYADLFEEIIMKALVNRSTFKKFIKRYCRIFLSSSNLERVPSF